MDIEFWLDPRWSLGSLGYPLWRALEQCPTLLACTGLSLLALIALALLLGIARELTGLRVFERSE